MSLKLHFIERGAPEAQVLGEVMPGECATFLDISRDEPVVYAMVCLRKALQRQEGDWLYGRVYAGDMTYLLEIPPDGLNPSNQVGDIVHRGHWHREVVSDERETGLLVVSHIPDGWQTWELS